MKTSIINGSEVSRLSVAIHDEFRVFLLLAPGSSKKEINSLSTGRVISLDIIFRSDDGTSLLATLFFAFM
ncbi:hypothetical protein, partial [Salmonella enterica]|uniref:hypothetical protein n=1 Tax=Salmonella enterica TaxID=28901 RepID=UPI003D1B22EF